MQLIIAVAACRGDLGRCIFYGGGAVEPEVLCFLTGPQLVLDIQDLWRYLKPREVQSNPQAVLCKVNIRCDQQAVVDELGAVEVRRGSRVVRGQKLSDLGGSSTRLMATTIAGICMKGSPVYEKSVIGRRRQSLHVAKNGVVKIVEASRRTRRDCMLRLSVVLVSGQALEAVVRP